MTPLDLMAHPPYSIPAAERASLLLDGFNALSQHHYDHCLPYRRILDGGWPGSRDARSIEDVPYLPVTLFKTHELRSVDDTAVKMTLTSSGTTGQMRSTIAVDSETSNLQQRGLANSLAHMLGPKRLPLLVIDTPAVFKNPQLMSARGAGVLGMMRFGFDYAYAMDEGEAPDVEAVRQFLAKHGDKPFFIFGFTFMVWTQLYETFRDEGLDLSNGTLIHSGGWKKMIEKAVGNDEFRAGLKESFGLHRIYNFYGMVEQLGSIFVEGPGNLLYPPNFSDVIIRCPDSWEPLPIGETGVVQVLSLLPRSYPGHSLLTEDLGRIECIDPGIDGWMGKGLKIEGRVKNVELRGCSDIIATTAAAA